MPRHILFPVSPKRGDIYTLPKKKNPLRSDSEWVRGGDSRSRTDDPLLAKQVL